MSMSCISDGSDRPLIRPSTLCWHAFHLVSMSSTLQEPTKMQDPIHYAHRLPRPLVILAAQLLMCVLGYPHSTDIHILTHKYQDSFTALPVDRFSHSTALQYYQPLKSLTHFTSYAKKYMCP